MNDRLIVLPWKHCKQKDTVHVHFLLFGVHQVSMCTLHPKCQSCSNYLYEEEGTRHNDSQEEKMSNSELLSEMRLIQIVPEGVNAAAILKWKRYLRVDRFEVSFTLTANFFLACHVSCDEFV